MTTITRLFEMIPWPIVVVTLPLSVLAIYTFGWNRKAAIRIVLIVIIFRLLQAILRPNESRGVLVNFMPPLLILIQIAGGVRSLAKMISPLWRFKILLTVVVASAVCALFSKVSLEVDSAVPLIATSLIFASLLDRDRSPMRIVGAFLAILLVLASSFLRTWVAGSHGPIFFAMVGVNCIVYALFFLPASAPGAIQRAHADSCLGGAD